MKAAAKRIKVQPSTPKVKKPVGRRASKPEVLTLTLARSQLSECVQNAKGGRVTLLGPSRERAKSMFTPPGNFGSQQPTAVHEIAIDQLRKKLRTIREEVENSGAAYKIMVSGSESAVFCPTQLAWDSKISRSRDNMLSALLAEMNDKLSGLASAMSETDKRLTAEIRGLVDASAETGVKVNRVLALSEAWFKRWRKDQGLPETPFEA